MRSIGSGGRVLLLAISLAACTTENAARSGGGGDDATYRPDASADAGPRPGEDGSPGRDVGPGADGAAADGQVGDAGPGEDGSIKDSAPIAAAVAPPTLAVGTEGRLDASGSSDPDGDALLFTWTQTEGAAVEIRDAHAAVAAFTAPAHSGTLRFHVVVSDGIKESGADVSVDVVNQQPVAAAGDPQTVDGGAQVTLDGTGSIDPDGLPLAYAWEQVGGPAVQLDGADTAQPTFTAPIPRGDVTFQLTVNDGEVDSEPAETVVTVRNHAPTPSVQAPDVVDGGAMVVLDASGSSDLDGDPLTFSWTQTEGPEALLDDPTAAAPTFIAPALRARLVFDVTVSDGIDEAVGEVVVGVADQPPIAEAGPSVAVTGGTRVQLDGRASHDPDGDPLGFSWTQLEGPEVMLRGADSAQPTFDAPVGRAALAFQLVVNDGTLDSAPDLVRISIDDQVPVADAGPDQVVQGGDLVSLDGSRSSDADGDPLTFRWTQVEGPDVELQGAESATPAFTAPAGRGRIVFELVVNDGTVESAPDRVAIDIGNRPPVADAGGEQRVMPAADVTLDGSGSSDPDGDALTYAWRQVSGTPVHLSDAAAAQPAFRAPADRATLVFELVVSDGAASSEPATVRVLVDNTPPVADAGPDQRDVEHGLLVHLDGSGSHDPEADPLTYRWTQTAGPRVVLSDPTAPSPSFVAPLLKRTLTFQLVVNDRFADSDPDTVSVTTANTAPVADAGPDRDASGGDEIVLDGAGSRDPDGDPLTWRWTQIEGPPVAISDPSAISPTVTLGATHSQYRFEVTVSDGDAEARDEVVITVGNHPPVADAGEDAVVPGGVRAHLDGRASSDADGDALTFHWTQTGGAAVQLDGADGAQPSFLTATAHSAYTFALVVNDGTADSPPDEVTLTVPDNAPVVSAGDDQVVDGDSVVQLGGTATDADGDPLTYAWTQVSGPEVALEGADTLTPSFMAPVERGELVFHLTVDDGFGATTDDVQIAIRNHAPEADSGPDQDVAAGDDVRLDGTGSFDLDGDDLTYTWTQVAGPEVQLDDPTAAQPQFTAPDGRGSYQFQLVVNDGLVDSAPDVVTIGVGNRIPIANAGPDQQVPGSSVVTLDGTASSDPERDPLTYAWTQTDGPAVVLSDATAAQPQFTAPQPRSALTFQLVVNDGFQDSAPDTVTIHTPNNAPVANAGPDLVAAANGRVTLDGRGSSDLDGDALTYTWQQVDGPAVMLQGADTAQPTFTAPGMRASLTFLLRVNDGTDDSDLDLVVVSVGNQRPVADAGPDQNVRPSTVVTLDGTRSSDPDGDPLTYTWTQVGGRAVQLSDAHAARPTFNAPRETGRLVFQLVVSDGVSSSEADQVNVDVGNRQPVSLPGAGQTVDGGSVVTLDGSASFDPDGDPLTYRWAQIGGGTPVLLQNANSAVATFTAPVPRQRLTFRLIVNDGLVDSIPATTTVDIRNHVPTADAGPDQSVNGGSGVRLDGTHSADLDGDRLTFTWRQVSGDAVTLNDVHAPSPGFIAPVRHQALVFELVVNDGITDSAPDQVTIAVANHAPVANAGPDQTVAPSAAVQLDGSRSSDRDGDPLTFQWTQTEGVAVQLSDATAPTPTFTAPDRPDRLVFTLVVNDGIEPSAADTVSVVVGNVPPVADAGPDQDVDGGSGVRLDGRASSDANRDRLGFRWTQTAGDAVQLQGANTAQPTFTAPIRHQTLTFQLIVNDGTQDSAPDTVNVNVRNHAPTANAGPDQAVPRVLPVQLDGSRSSDVDGDALGYTWTQTAGAHVDLSDAHAVSPQFLAPLQRQVLTFQLVVNDGITDSAPDTVNIVVGDHAPVANAGPDFPIRTGGNATLDGRGSFDIDGDPLTYAWVQTAGNPVQLHNANTARPTFTAPDRATNLTFQLTVTDPYGLSSTDTVVVSVVRP